jgi:hypothetical protein
MTAPAVLTAASTLTCPHHGTVAAATASRLRVAGQPVLLAPLTGQPIGADCTVMTNPSTSTKKCFTVAGVSAGDSSRLTVRGTSVLLATLVGQTDGTPPPLPAGPPLITVANQTRLRAAVKP